MDRTDTLDSDVGPSQQLTEHQLLDHGDLQQLHEQYRALTTETTAIMQRIIDMRTNIGDIYAPSLSSTSVLSSNAPVLSDGQQEPHMKGFSVAFNYNSRVSELQDRYPMRRDPNSAVIFLTKTIVEALVHGPLSEQEMKLVLQRTCTMQGIKLSRRGVVAGSSMDIGAVCSVLHAVGAVEPVPFNHDRLLTAPGPNRLDAEQEHHPARDHPLLYALTSRWKDRLAEFHDDVRRIKAERERSSVPSGGSIGDDGELMESTMDVQTEQVLDDGDGDIDDGSDVDVRVNHGSQQEESTVLSSGAGIPGHTSSSSSASAAVVRHRRCPSAMKVWQLRSLYGDDDDELKTSDKWSEGDIGDGGHNRVAIRKPNVYKATATTVGAMLRKESECRVGEKEGVVDDRLLLGKHLQHASHGEGKRVDDLDAFEGHGGGDVDDDDEDDDTHCSLSVDLLRNPSNALTYAAMVDYDYQSAMEMEELLVRRLAGQCDLMGWPLQRLRLGTTYLSGDAIPCSNATHGTTTDHTEEEEEEVDEMVDDAVVKEMEEIDDGGDGSSGGVVKEIVNDGDAEHVEEGDHPIEESYDDDDGADGHEEVCDVIGFEDQDDHHGDHHPASLHDESVDDDRPVFGPSDPVSFIAPTELRSARIPLINRKLYRALHKTRRKEGVLWATPLIDVALDGVEGEGEEEEMEEGIATAAYLIDQVEQSRRQIGRTIDVTADSSGRCMVGALSTNIPYEEYEAALEKGNPPIHIYSSSSLHRLQCIADATTEAFWGIPSSHSHDGSTTITSNTTASNGPNSNFLHTKPSHRRGTSSINQSHRHHHAITVCEFLRSNANPFNSITPDQSPSASPTNFTAPSLPVSFASTSILYGGDDELEFTFPVIRRYSQPLALHHYHHHHPPPSSSSSTVFNPFAARSTFTGNNRSVPPYSIEIEDLRLDIREIAWVEIAREFEVVSSWDDHGTTMMTAPSSSSLGSMSMPLSMLSIDGRSEAVDPHMMLSIPSFTIKEPPTITIKETPTITTKETPSFTTKGTTSLVDVHHHYSQRFDHIAGTPINGLITTTTSSSSLELNQNQAQTHRQFNQLDNTKAMTTEAANHVDLLLLHESSPPLSPTPLPQMSSTSSPVPSSLSVQQACILGDDSIPKIIDIAAMEDHHSATNDCTGTSERITNHRMDNAAVVTLEHVVDTTITTTTIPSGGGSSSISRKRRRIPGNFSDEEDRSITLSPPAIPSSASSSIRDHDATMTRRIINGHHLDVVSPEDDDDVADLCDGDRKRTQLKTALTQKTVIEQLDANDAMDDAMTSSSSSEEVVEDEEDEEEVEEDTSDEAVLRRHERTLQSMRDKWTLIQQLRSEIYSDPMMMTGSTGGGGVVTNSSSYPMADGGGSGGGYGYYVGGSSTATTTSLLTPVVDTNHTHPPTFPTPHQLSTTATTYSDEPLSPRRGQRSHYLSGGYRRRGRPPKFIRNSQRNNNIINNSNIICNNNIIINNNKVSACPISMEAILPPSGDTTLDGLNPSGRGDGDDDNNDVDDVSDGM